jgi:hypothetical protein
MKAAILVILILSFLESHGQGIYEIKYQFYMRNERGENTTVLTPQHTALVFFYDAESENNIMRIIYTGANSEKFVVEQKVHASTSNIEGVEYWVLYGTDATFVKPDGFQETYYPDHIVLSRKTGSDTYAPDFVMDDNKSVGIINSWKVLKRYEVTNTYLAPFDWHWPAESTTEPSYTLGALRLVLVTNSNDPSLGTGFSANHKKLKSMFKDIALTCGMKFYVTEIMGDDFSREAVSSKVENFYSTSNDVIVFYYSGHGFRASDPQTDWPQLDLRSSFSQDRKTHSLNLDFDIYQSLKAVDHRLLIVVGECCNTSGGTPYSSDPIMMAAGENVIDQNSVKNLFNRSGEVLIATSKPGQGSWYYTSNGGYFCNNFISSFMRQVGFTASGRTAKWTDIFNQAIVLTTQAAEHDQDPSFQNPITHYSIKEDDN